MVETFNDHGISVGGARSGEVDTLCPQCSHTRKKKTDKCLSVNVDEGTWFCHHCNWSGGLHSGRRDWSDARKARKVWVKPKYEPEMVLPAAAMAFFTDRGISPETVANEGIGYLSGWIKFPYYRNGEVINVKSRRLDAKEFFQEKGAEKILYGMVPVTAQDPPTRLIWVEGEMDRLALLEAGYRYVVSVPDGAPAPGTKMSDLKFEYLENCEDYIRQFTEHVIAVDSDAPGQALREELSRRIGVERCLRVSWPDGVKDANELLMKQGVKAVCEAVAAARYLPVDGIFEVRDIMQDAFEMYQNGITRGVSTGFPSLDPLMTIRPGELCILTGIPSHGKSSLLDAICVNLAEKEDFRIGVFSPENAPLAQHMKKLAELYSGKPFFEGPTERMGLRDLADAAQFLQEHFFFISPREDAFTIDQILERAKVLVFRHGINFLIIDPYNDIDQPDSRDNESRAASLLLSKCQRFARLNKVFVCLVAHPTKLRKDDRTQKYPVPTPYDISGSAHFRNRGDICCCAYRPDDNKDFIEFHIQKVRFKEIGKTGMVRLNYNKVNGRFFEHNPHISETERKTLRRRVNAELEAARKAHDIHDPDEDRCGVDYE